MNQKLQALLTKLQATAKSFWAKVTSDVGDLWERDKTFVVLFGVIILGVKFRDILINLIVSSSKTLFNKAKKQSDALQSQEQADNSRADSLVQQSQQLTDSNPPINDDWNKNEK